MIKKIVTKKNLTALVLGALVMASASPVWAESFSDTSKHDEATEQRAENIYSGSSTLSGIYHGGNNILTFNDNMTVTGGEVTLEGHSKTNFNKDLNVTSTGRGIYTYISSNTFDSQYWQDTDFNGKVNITADGDGIHSRIGGLKFHDDVTIKTGGIGVLLDEVGNRVEFHKGLIIGPKDGSTTSGLAMYTKYNGDNILVNTGKNGNVQITGGISARQYSNIEVNLTNADSFIKGDVTSNRSTININAASGNTLEGKFTNIHGNLNMNANGDNNTFKGSFNSEHTYCTLNFTSNGNDNKILSDFNSKDRSLLNFTSKGDDNTISGNFTASASDLGSSTLNFTSTGKNNTISGAFTTDETGGTINATVGDSNAAVTDTSTITGAFTSNGGNVTLNANGANTITSDFINNGTGNVNLNADGSNVIEGQFKNLNDGGANFSFKGDNKVNGDFTNDGTGTVKVDSSDSRFDSDFINNGTGTVDLTFNGDTITGDTDGFISKDTGNVIVNATNSTITSNLSSENTGSVEVTMAGTSTLTGKSTINEDNPGTVNVKLLNGTQWNVTDTSTLSKLDLSADSVVDLAGQEKKNKTMTIAELHGGGGTFVLGSDVTQNTENDKIVVTDSFTGKANLALVDTTGSGILKEGAVNTVLATTIKNGGDNDGVFSAVSAETPLYWMGCKLSSEDSASYGSNYTDWFIAAPPVDLSRPTTTVDTIMSSAVGSYYAWRTHNDKLMQRLGDLRQSQNEDQGIWARITRDGTEYDNNAYFHNNTSTMQLGYDKVVSRDTKDNYWVAGGAIGYINGSGSYHYGSSDNSGATLSLYGTRMGNKGHYLDLVATIGKYNNHFNSYMTSNFRQNGDYDTLGYSVSAEYGRRTPLKSGWYVEPQMQLTFGHLNSVDYITTNKVRVDQDGVNSAIGRIGFNIGRSVGQKANFYLKANLSHEFGGSGHVAMSTSNQNRNEDLSLDDTWFTYGLGVSAPVNKDSYMYFDIERSTGSDFTTDWQWNAGMRFSI